MFSLHGSSCNFVLCLELPSLKMFLICSYFSTNFRLLVLVRVGLLKSIQCFLMFSTSNKPLCSRLLVKTSDEHHRICSGVFAPNLEHTDRRIKNLANNLRWSILWKQLTGFSRRLVRIFAKKRIENLSNNYDGAFLWK